MPAAAIIVPLAVSAASTAATTALIGTTLAATLGVVGGAIVTGAIGGAVGGAITGGIEGGDVGMDVLTGAVGGGVSGGVGAELAGTPTEGITNTIQNVTGASPSLAGDITTGLVKGGAGFAGATAAGLAGGQKFGQALKSGAVSGISSGIASGLGSAAFGGNQAATQTNPSVAQLERAQGKFGALPFFPGDTNQPPPSDFQSFSFNPNLSNPDLVNQPQSGGSQLLNQGTQGALSRGISTGLNDILSTGQPSGGSIASGGPVSGPTQSNSLNLPQVSTGVGTTNPSVSALAQALRTVPDLGYSPGGPVFGSQSTAKPKKVWNRASLRVMDEETP